MENNMQTEGLTNRNRRSSEDKIARRHRRRRGIILGICIGLLIMIYGGGRFYFTKHFFPGTEINSVACGMKTPEEAYEKISEYLSTYQLKIYSEDGELSLPADEAGLRYVNHGELDQILQKQDVNLWFLSLKQSAGYQTMSTSLDDEKLNTAVAGLACMNPKEPRVSQNATISYDKKSGSYQITEGELGNEVNVETFTAAVKQAMLDGKDSVDLLSGTFYLPAKYTASSKKVIKAKEKADKYLKSKIHYKKNGKKLELKPKRIQTFIKIDEKYKVKLDEDVIRRYVEENVSKKFDTTDRLTVIPSPGSGNIYVAKGEGSQAVNVEAETRKLMENLKAGKAVTREPQFVEDYLYSSNADIVKKDFVDINISKQKVYVVKRGKIAVQSDCVTGNVSIGRSTPTGIYRIAYKTTNHHMVKYNAFVHYWMPYDTRYGIGLHDATWRSAFGGNIFRTDGSHACINLPIKKAGEIYDAVYAGIPVIVHW